MYLLSGLSFCSALSPTLLFLSSFPLSYMTIFFSPHCAIPISIHTPCNLTSTKNNTLGFLHLSSDFSSLLYSYLSEGHDLCLLTFLVVQPRGGIAGLTWRPSHKEGRLQRVITKWEWHSESKLFTSVIFLLLFSPLQAGTLLHTSQMLPTWLFPRGKYPRS